MYDMNASGQQIVQALSVIEVPEHMLRQIDVRGMVKSLSEASSAVQKNTADLERARQEVKDGTWIGNWWNDRKDKVEDIQFDLQKSIGELTKRTTQLLVFNTAISRELSKQQQTLLRQQEQLQQQTRSIEQQNNDILEQQKILEQQQKEINAANQGLLEAKGITAEQAIKLVGCVRRVEEAETKMEASNQSLMKDISDQLAGIAEDFGSNLEKLSDDFLDRVSKLDRHIADQLDMLREQQASNVQDMQNKISSMSMDFESRLNDTASLHENMLKNHSEATERRLGDIRREAASSIESGCSSLQDMIAALSSQQADEVQRLEAVIKAQASDMRNENGRRFKGHFIALILISCATFAVAGIQALNYLHR